ncbi:ABC transporter ATP-binding protein [Mesorhizobium opportunistum]
MEAFDLQTVFWSRKTKVYAVNGVSFHLNRGEILGVVGESGSGKSATMMSLMRLLPTPPAEIVSGRAHFEGRDLLSLAPSEIQRIRGREIGVVFQDPMTSLNPVLTVGYQLMEPIRKHLGLSRSDARKRAAELLAMVGIPSPQDRMNDYPHQFSGGMRQRVVIAIALAGEPKVLIADEPTTALDVTIQAQILELVKKLRQEMSMSIIWITHDLGVVAGIADRVMVMYGGLVVECAAVGDLYANPRHPYTRALLETLPRADMTGRERLKSVRGQPPHLTAFPTSCPFAPRCPHVFDRCLVEKPPLIRVRDGHEAACWWGGTEQRPRGDV